MPYPTRISDLPYSSPLGATAQPEAEVCPPEKSSAPPSPLLYVSAAGSAAGESTTSKPVLGKRLSLSTALTQQAERLTRPCTGQRAAVSLADLGNGAAQRGSRPGGRTSDQDQPSTSLDLVY